MGCKARIVVKKNGGGGKGWKGMGWKIEKRMGGDVEGREPSC